MTLLEEQIKERWDRIPYYFMAFDGVSGDVSVRLDVVPMIADVMTIVRAKKDITALLGLLDGARRAEAVDKKSLELDEKEHKLDEFEADMEKEEREQCGICKRTFSGLDELLWDAGVGFYICRNCIERIAGFSITRMPEDGPEEEADDEEPPKLLKEEEFPHMVLQKWDSGDYRACMRLDPAPLRITPTPDTHISEIKRMSMGWQIQELEDALDEAKRFRDSLNAKNRDK